MTSTPGAPASPSAPVPQYATPANASPKPALAHPAFSLMHHGAIWWAVAGILAVVFVIGMLLAVALHLMQLGPVTMAIAAVAAVMPVPIYLGVFIWLDRFEPEPPSLLIACFMWGATFSYIIAAIMNTIFSVVIFKITGNEHWSNQLGASISAPFMEESLKGLAVLTVFLFKRKEFDGVLDGIIYAGVTALGFAMTENIQYYGGALVDGGSGGLVVSFILRGVLEPYGHVLFTSATGIGFGLAANTKNTAMKFVFPLCGWFLAMCLHATWNSLPALLGKAFNTGNEVVDNLGPLAVSYAIVWVPTFCVLIGLIVWSLKRESKMISQELDYYVKAGDLTPEEVKNLTRLIPRLTGMAVGPNASASWTARHKYTRVATSLAFYRYRIQCGRCKADADLEASQLALLKELRAHPVTHQPGGRPPGTF